MSLAEIVHAVRLPKTTVFRTFSSPAARGFCQWDAPTDPWRSSWDLLFAIASLQDQGISRSGA